MTKAIAEFAFKALYFRFQRQFDAVALNMKELGDFMNGGPDPIAFEDLPPSIVAVLRAERMRRQEKGNAK